jgi:uncharacterized protein (TIGR03437 family)
VCPLTEPGAQLSIWVENEFGITEPVSTVTANAVPGMFSLDGSGQGQGLVMLAGTSDLAIMRNARVKGQPVQSGDFISIYVTGLPHDREPILEIDGGVVETGAVLPVDGQMGVWEIQARVSIDVAGKNQVSLVLEILQPDNTIVRSNEVTFAVEGRIR